MFSIVSGRPKVHYRIMISRIFEGRSVFAFICVVTLCVAFEQSFAADVPNDDDIPYVDDIYPVEASPHVTNPYEANRLDTLHYRTPGGSFNFAGSWGECVNCYSNAFPSGGNSDYHSSVFAGYVSYGVLDNLSVAFWGDRWTGISSFGSLHGYDLNDSATTNFLTIDFRYLGKLKGQSFGSVYFGIQPPWGSTSAPEVQNVVTPGQTSVTLGTRFYWVLGAHEFGLDGEANYRGSVTYKDPGNYYTNTGDAYWVFEMNGEYRFHFLNRFFIAPSLSLTPAFSDTYSYPNETSFYQERRSYDWRLSESAELGWLVTSFLTVGVTYTHNAYTETITPTAGSNAGPSGFADNQHLVSFSAEFQI
jgi:hypothetical protein